MANDHAGNHAGWLARMADGVAEQVANGIAQGVTDACLNQLLDETSADIQQSYLRVLGSDGAGEDIDELSAFPVYFDKIASDVGIVFQISTQALSALPQSMTNILDFHLHGLVFCLISKPLEGTSLIDECLIAVLQSPLLTDNATNLSADESCQFISVLKHIRSNGPEKLELLYGLIEDDRNAGSYYQVFR